MSAMTQIGPITAQALTALINALGKYVMPVVMEKQRREACYGAVVRNRNRRELARISLAAQAVSAWQIMAKHKVAVSGCCVILIVNRA